MYWSRIQSSSSLADDAALGMEEDQAGPGEFLDAEQVELLAELAVVALLGLFQPLQVLVQFLLGEEGGAVDALQLLVVLVALPVGAGDGQQLERLDRSVDGTCGPRQKSMNFGPERVLGEDRRRPSRRSARTSSHPSSYFLSPSAFAVNCARRAGRASGSPTSSSRSSRGRRA